jgi:alkanesulfonate monooxygenase SsuD/methylene tetrahydromethanopterin reductase-like flavin-dependent oxidoreductase (luciferase family)
MSLENSSGPTVTFGFDWIDADGVRDAGQLHRERLDLLSISTTWPNITAHRWGLVPSPNVFLGAAAMRTTRIRLCPLVYVLPLYHPARLAEEVAMLDQLSGGRLDVGFGKGGNPHELLPYGIEPGDAQRRYDKVFASVMQVLETGTIGAPGDRGGRR